MKGLNVTRVVAGEKVLPKVSKAAVTPKAAFVRRLISQLNDALVINSRELEKLHEISSFDIKLQKRIEEFHSKVISVLDSFPADGLRVPKAFYDEVKLFVPTVDKFIKEFKQNHLPDNDTALSLVFTIMWMAEDVKHFANQVTMTYSSVAAITDPVTGKILPPRKTEISNRLRDPKKEAVFLEAIDKYKAQGGKKKFMPYTFAERIMKTHGLSIPERTYRTFKTDYLAGNFGKFAK
jgi:hypothetical protein